MKLRGRIEITDDEEVERQRERSSGLWSEKTKALRIVQCGTWGKKKESVLRCWLRCAPVRSMHAMSPCLPRVLHISQDWASWASTDFRKPSRPKKNVRATTQLHYKNFYKQWGILCFHVFFFFIKKKVNYWLIRIRVTKNN